MNVIIVLCIYVRDKKASVKSVKYFSHACVAFSLVDLWQSSLASLMVCGALVCKSPALKSSNSPVSLKFLFSYSYLLKSKEICGQTDLGLLGLFMM